MLNIHCNLELVQIVYYGRLKHFYCYMCIFVRCYYFIDFSLNFVKTLLCNHIKNDCISWIMFKFLLESFWFVSFLDRIHFLQSRCTPHYFTFGNLDHWMPCLKIKWDFLYLLMYAGILKLTYSSVLSSLCMTICILAWDHILLHLCKKFKVDSEKDAVVSVMWTWSVLLQTSIVIVIINENNCWNCG